MFHVEQDVRQRPFPTSASDGATGVRSCDLRGGETVQARVLAVANQKGGVGKTTTTINLAAALALADQAVLAVDLDPQANLTSGLGQTLDGRRATADAPRPLTVYDALTNEAPPVLDDYLLPTPVAGLSLVAADNSLAGAELELVGLERRERRLRPLLEQARQRFDYVLIDTPPSLGLLTVNALIAAEAVLIPMTCEYYALEGLATLMATLRRVQATFNPHLGVAGVVFTMADLRTNLAQQVAADVRDVFGEAVFETTIPRNIRLAEAPSHGLPVILYDVRSRGAEAYQAMATEFLARTRGAAAAAEGTTHRG